MRRPTKEIHLFADSALGVNVLLVQSIKESKQKNNQIKKTD